jgi:hypothetical protein
MFAPTSQKISVCYETPFTTIDVIRVLKVDKWSRILIQKLTVA